MFNSIIIIAESLPWPLIFFMYTMLGEADSEVIPIYNEVKDVAYSDANILTTQFDTIKILSHIIIDFMNHET